MPANLPPDYFDAEKRYRAAKTAKEKITRLEEMLTIMPKHKGTDKLRADLRRRISRLKDASQSKKGAAKRDSAFHFDKEGAAQVVVVGPTNVGKSTLVAALTNATPEIAPYPNTSWRPTPGMMPVGNIPIQLIDTPPLDREYIEPELIDLIRRADLVLLVVDLQTDPMSQLQNTISLLDDYRIVPRRLKDQIEQQQGLTFLLFQVLANKNDDATTDEDVDIFSQLLEDDWPVLAVSAVTGRNLEELKRTVVRRLELIRVYSKAPGKEPDYSAPFVMKKGSTVADFAGMVHQDFAKRLKTARLWGKSVFDGQLVQREHPLEDGDVVEMRI
jgi:ribosome-interacting GTPase 1